jgi:DNA-binding transcriptional MocR family regulator
MSSQLNLYENLANELGGLIAGQVYVAGDRLPSIRHLAQQKKVSVSTVMQAFRLLEDRGLIDARPQAGFYVKRQLPRIAANQALSAPTLREPTYVGINNVLMQVLKANEKQNVVQLGSAWPPDALFPVEQVRRIVNAKMRTHAHYLTQVSSFDTSEPNFVRQVQRRALVWGQIDLNEIVVTSSCTEAISLCLRAVAKPGDTIAIESATFFLLLQLIESLGMKALEIPTHPKTGVSIDALELAMQQNLVQACLFIPNANNPLGCIMPEENKKRLAALVAKYDIPLIEDDVYGDLCFVSERPAPVKAYDTSGNVLMCSSFSKAITPAARVGFVLGGKYAQQVALLRTVSGGCTAYFFQAVLAEFIQGRAYDSQVRKLRKAFSQRIGQMADAVSRYFPQGSAVSEPQGGLVLWVELPTELDTLALHRKAIGEGIAFMPGSLFSASGKLGNCMRLNCGNPWSPEIEDAVERLGRLAQEELEKNPQTLLQQSA